jgi:UDP-glucose 4-epimerase
VSPDLVFHLGEYARIAPSFEDVELVHDMNTVGTFAVAEFCRKRGVGKLVYSASSTKFAVEGEGRNQSPYAFTKAQNVDLLNNYGRWFDLPYAICYFYNAYGPRERADDKYGTVIANFERAYLEGRPLRVVKPGTQRRAFTHVRDLARGILRVGESGRGDGYALGCEESYSVSEIADAFTGAPVELVDGDPGRSASHNDWSKARDELGWRPEVRVMDYIRDFVRRHPHG